MDVAPGQAKVLEEAMRLRVQLVRKEEASPEVRRLFEDIQDSLGIPWVPSNFRAFATYPRVALLFWEQLKPTVCSEQFLRAALTIGERAYRSLSESYEPVFGGQHLREWGVLDADLGRICWELDAFEFGNPQVLVLQYLLQAALRGQALPGVGTPEPRHAPSSYRHLEMELVDPAQPPDTTVARLFRDIRTTLGVPVISSEYQALAIRPGFLELLWREVKRERRSDRYRRLEGELARMAEAAATQLPGAVAIDRRELERALGRATSMPRLLALVDLFTSLLPGLILSDAIFRIGAAIAPPVGVPNLAPKRF